MGGERSPVERERHGRARWYVTVCFVLAVCAYEFLGFDRVQAVGYAVSCFVMLHLVNFRAMLAPIPEPSSGRSSQPNQ